MLTSRTDVAFGSFLVSRRSAAALLLLALAGAPAERGVRGEDWPQFLGPARNGLSAERGLLDAWPADGPPELWRVPGGVGMSGLSVLAGRLVTLANRDGRQVALALDAESGEELWATPLAPEYRNRMGDGPRATPALEGGRAFVLTGEGILAALDLDTGDLVWRKDLTEELGGRPPEYGTACSPLLVEGRVVVHAGRPKGQVAAFDAATGELAWAHGEGRAGYSSPTLLPIAGTPQLVSFVADRVLALEPRSGKLLWEYGYLTDYDCNIAAPLALEGDVFLSAGENHGCLRLRVGPQGDGFRLTEVWSSQGVESVLRNEWQTSILWQGKLYGFDNVGSAGPVTHLTCVDAATGERLWREARFGKGNLIAADGKLFLTTLEGELVLARLSPEGYQELGRRAVLGATRQAPALADGRLYLRDDQDIVCLDVRK